MSDADSADDVDGLDGEVSQDCPECGEEFEPHPNHLPGLFWCDDCEKEYWQEGIENPTWFACSIDGVIHSV